MSDSSEFDLPEGICDDDFIAALPDTGPVQLGAHFPVTLDCEWDEELGGPELESAGSSQDPSFDPSTDIPSDPLSELSLSEADKISGSQQGDEEAMIKSEERGYSRTFSSAAQLRAALSQTESTRSSNSSKSALSSKLLAQRILQSLKTEDVGRCKLSILAASKSQGYVQLSWASQNKFAVLQDVLLWARGLTKGLGQQMSHLCHRPKCTLPEHVCAESVEDNNARKGCVVHMPCLEFCGRCHGKKSVWYCCHVPPCILEHDEYASQDDFLTNGICHSRSSDVREQKRRRAA